MASVIIAGGATGIGRAAVQGQAIDAQIPLRRHGEPVEVSSLVLFLASPAGRYIAGTSIVVDGGYTAV